MRVVWALLRRDLAQMFGGGRRGGAVLPVLSVTAPSGVRVPLLVAVTIVAIVLATSGSNDRSGFFGTGEIR